MKAELDQILCGLSETHNILELVRSNAPNMRSLFVYETRPPLTANYVMICWQQNFLIQAATEERRRKLL